MLHRAAAHCIYLYHSILEVYLDCESARCLSTPFCRTGVPQVPTILDSFLTLLHWIQQTCNMFYLYHFWDGINTLVLRKMMTCKQGTWANDFLLNACCDSQLWTKCPLHGYPESKLRQCWSMRSSMPDFPSSCFYEWAAENLWQWTLLFLPGAKYATSQLVELDHSSIERECPLSCLRILWVKLGTSLQGEHPNVIQMKKQAVKPSTRLVREECSDFFAASILYQSCPFARRRSHRWSS